LLSTSGSLKRSTLKNIRLKYLQFEQDKECKIIESNNISFQTFTIITFKSTDRELQEYFLQISETFIKSLNRNLDQQQVAETFRKFIEIFRYLGETPQKTVQGLWSELFLINNAHDPKILLTYWHNLPDEKFDFNAGREKIEVKSSSNFERQHIFSSGQLNPPLGTQVLVASIFMQETSSGQTIQYLIDNIASKVQHDLDLTIKLNRVVCQTLGNTLEDSLRKKFDYQIAKESLRFYRHQDINKVEEAHIPVEVSDVKFKSDLSNVSPIDLRKTSNKDILFSNI
jgi:hypothetical protein